ncbi:LysM peptidoglycan-binding domain-containing protein [Robiginitalea sp. SC105]|uniref:LysM peptidoglycan-binding domain-containing protein n=1 Tax=Robiginitalea sp. SC105 TaxID=2762332 RepID=UPI00163AFD2F|nr:LysM peptidoglycan-binding domain-containing protein [Robiginitalea sp. SC105]MBC2838217.1 LysM peptidoglycan-binding domain-containing protein [Robiginitalea sp. SC105]
MKKLFVAGALTFLGAAFGQQESMDSGDARDTVAQAAVATQPLGLADIQEVSFSRADSARLRDHKLAARYDSLWMHELRQAADRYPQMYAEIQLAGSDSLTDSTGGFDTELFKQRLVLLNQKTPFNITYSASLESVVKTFLTRKRDLMERMLTASQFYFPMFEETLDKHGLPLEIKYLAIVESALNPKARSRVGATGLWQFMYSTGRMYDLDVSSYVDERNDPIESTEAAAKYLKRLYEIFGDWDLALAAYNSGPGNVNKAIRRSGGYTNYWNLRPFLPRETAGYVPAFFAAMYIFEYAADHGLNFTPAERPYFETDTVWVKSTITFDQISRATGIPEAEIAMLNPAYKLSIIPKVDGKNYVLRLPRRAVGSFVANEEAVYAMAREEIAKQEKALPQMVEAEDRIRYRVRSGDYLGKIAERYGVGVSQIKRWNGLRSNDLRIGQRLTIYPRKPVTSTATPSAKTGSGVAQSSGDGPTVHVVREGDSLWTISRKYPGVSIENLREWNGIRGNNLQPGTRLKLCNCSS